MIGRLEHDRFKLNLCLIVPDRTTRPLSLRERVRVRASCRGDVGAGGGAAGTLTLPSPEGRGFSILQGRGGELLSDPALSEAAEFLYTGRRWPSCARSPRSAATLSSAACSASSARC